MTADPLPIDGRVSIARVGAALVSTVGERVTDAGSASEAFYLVYRVFVATDSGTITEVVIRPTRTMPIPDTGTTDEVIERAGRYVSTTDTASGSDIIDGIYWLHAVTDASGAVEAVRNTSFIISRETFTGDDQVRTTKSLIVIVDGLTAGDAVLVNKDMRMVEAGHASEAVRALKGLLIPEVATALERVLSQRPLVLIVDTTASDDSLLAQKPLVRILDPATGNDIALSHKSFNVADAGDVLEDLLADKLLIQEDAATGDDYAGTPSRLVISADDCDVLEQISRYFTDVLRVEIDGSQRPETAGGWKEGKAASGRVEADTLDGNQDSPSIEGEGND